MNDDRLKCIPQISHTTVCSSVIQCTDVVRDLGVLLHNEMTMQRHISKVTSVCFYHLRRLRQIRNYVSQTVMAQLVMSLVIIRLTTATQS